MAKRRRKTETVELVSKRCSSKHLVSPFPRSLFLAYVLPRSLSTVSVRSLLKSSSLCAVSVFLTRFKVSVCHRGSLCATNSSRWNLAASGWSLRGAAWEAWPQTRMRSFPSCSSAAYCIPLVPRTRTWAHWHTVGQSLRNNNANSRRSRCSPSLPESAGARVTAQSFLMWLRPFCWSRLDASGAVVLASAARASH